MRYLIKTVETYRCDTEDEAKDFIESQKKSNDYTLTKSTDEIKEVKVKGEIVDEYRLVSLTKVFDNAKEPVGDVKTVEYSTHTEANAE